MTTIDRPATRTRRVLAVAAGLHALSAWGGAVGLTTGALDFGDRLNARLPFDSLVLAGLALAVVVALPATVLAVRAWRGDPRTSMTATVVGALVVGWILVQLVFLRELSFFHPLYLAVGLAFVAAGRR